ncbi:hypothetical protein [Streptomyces sp. NPDC056169]|uniref:hypothetical protein n=1 Tax=Streptomyces sp. NPDC056169 TaxID=3345734 RepID=UPI0035DBC994
MTWVPQSCTLPTEAQPLRIAEFDTLFADALIRVERPTAILARLVLDAVAEPAAQELASTAHPELGHPLAVRARGRPDSTGPRASRAWP